MSYSLDGLNNVTIVGNSTLTNLPNGEHNVTVYAKDTVGNIRASQTIFFTIKAEPFPIVTTVVSQELQWRRCRCCVFAVMYVKKRRASGVGGVKNP